MPAGILFLDLKLSNGIKDLPKTSATEREEVLSIKSCVFDRILLSSFIEAISKEVESVSDWALEHATAKKKMTRVAKCFTSRMFSQTYINSTIPHISNPSF